MSNSGNDYYELPISDRFKWTSEKSSPDKSDTNDLYHAELVHNSDHTDSNTSCSSVNSSSLSRCYEERRIKITKPLSIKKSPSKTHELDYDDLRHIVDNLESSSIESQCNTIAYLQHLTFQNEKNKKILHRLKTLDILNNLFESKDDTLRKNMMGLLQNMSFQTPESIKHEFHESGIFDNILSLISQIQEERREATGKDLKIKMEIRDSALATLQNLSVDRKMGHLLAKNAIHYLVSFLLAPELENQLGVDSSPKSNELNSLSYKNDAKPFEGSAGRNKLSVYITGIIRNMCTDEFHCRQSLRDTPFLVQCLMKIAAFIRSECTTQFSIDNLTQNGIKSLENSVCALRNLSYACQETIDPAYLARKTQEYEELLKNLKDGGNYEVEPNILPDIGPKFSCSPCKSIFSRQSLNRIEANKLKMSITPEMENYRWLWEPSLVSKLYFDLITASYNQGWNVTCEACLGILTNLTACDWMHGRNLCDAIREGEYLETLIKLINNTENDSILNSSLQLMNNLLKVKLNRESVGEEYLSLLMKKLTEMTEKSVDNAERKMLILASVYSIIKNQPDYSRLFVEMDGIEHLNKIKDAYQDSSKFNEIGARKAAIFILRHLWGISQLQTFYKAKGLKGHKHFALAGPSKLTKSAAKMSYKNVFEITSGMLSNRKNQTLDNPIQRRNTSANILEPDALITSPFIDTKSMDRRHSDISIFRNSSALYQNSARRVIPLAIVHERRSSQISRHQYMNQLTEDSENDQNEGNPFNGEDNIFFSKPYETDPTINSCNGTIPSLTSRYMDIPPPLPERSTEITSSSNKV